MCGQSVFLLGGVCLCDEFLRFASGFRAAAVDVGTMDYDADADLFEVVADFQEVVFSVSLDDAIHPDDRTVRFLCVDGAGAAGDLRGSVKDGGKVDVHECRFLSAHEALSSAKITRYENRGESDLFQIGGYLSEGCGNGFDF